MTTGRILAAAGLAMAALALGATSASATSGVSVYVGYADGLRASPFFPVPFIGDPGTVSNGGFGSDNGLVRIDNNTGSAITVGGFLYSINFSGNIGGVANLVIPNGQKGIFVLGDTSDISYIPGATYGHLATGCSPACPIVNFTIDGGGLQSFNDSGHVLDTGGFDFASNGSNESFQWRLIGTSGGQSGAPEPATWGLMLIGLGGIGAGLRASRRTVSRVEV